MNDFTRAVLRCFLADREETRQTCLEWLDEAEGDREQAVRLFADAVAEDLGRGVLQVGSRRSRDPEDQLVAAFLKAGHERVCWSVVARALFDRLLPRKVRALIRPSVN